uniref:Uncharacterized protein n=1 Tax=Candidatus Kentrum sp. FM TaxID=2126340 RepID=A0A450SL71_9GAMM|nr:MAG: hypothetical protein BECKFM1743C_GA0114222_100361 [Candidatus Kentron sp. FM]VFJ54346.1 MAG: hypothetical protein BECKFM1743A_GA0114220_101301 [Candidatus Kentron sp. FM]VFK10052.1 MAG: hypothetical protein BECKFM1743B_GA0114221_101276 [Candidatus Kentron sp. FM]
MTISSAGDTPSGDGKTIKIPQNTKYTFNVNDFALMAPNANRAGEIEIDVISNRTVGSLRLENEPLAPGDFISAIDIRDGALIFMPSAGAAGSFRFSFYAWDKTHNGHNESSEQEAPFHKTLTISIGDTESPGNKIQDETGIVPGARDFLSNESFPGPITADDESADDESVTDAIITDPIVTDAEESFHADGSVDLQNLFPATGTEDMDIIGMPAITATPDTVVAPALRHTEHHPAGITDAGPLPAGTDDDDYTIDTLASLFEELESEEDAPEPFFQGGIGIPAGFTAVLMERLLQEGPYHGGSYPPVWIPEKMAEKMALGAVEEIADGTGRPIDEDVTIGHRSTLRCTTDSNIVPNRPEVIRVAANAVTDRNAGGVAGVISARGVVRQYGRIVPIDDALLLTATADAIDWLGSGTITEHEIALTDGDSGDVPDDAISIPGEFEFGEAELASSEQAGLLEDVIALEAGPLPRKESHHSAPKAALYATFAESRPREQPAGPVTEITGILEEAIAFIDPDPEWIIMDNVDTDHPPIDSMLTSEYRLGEWVSALIEQGVVTDSVSP